MSFHWVGIAPPYMFTENLSTVGDWVLPAILICTGTFLNARFTKRVPLILSWLTIFALQAVLRSLLNDTSIIANLLPMTGLAFLLFTFYMVSDPQTTPTAFKGQVVFGASVAAVYGLLLESHIVYTLFFALSIVCLARGAALYLRAWAERRQESPRPLAQRIGIRGTVSGSEIS